MSSRLGYLRNPSSSKLRPWYTVVQSSRLVAMLKRDVLSKPSGEWVLLDMVRWLVMLMSFE